jgi:hypothetical protein
VFNWGAAQPYPDWDHVPFDQVSNFERFPVPTTFAATDQLVALAASRGTSMLPVVIDASGWDVRPRNEVVAKLCRAAFCPAGEGPLAQASPRVDEPARRRGRRRRCRKAL